MQRSKREGSEIGFVARKHSETDLRMQRSGRESAVVGFAGQEQTEANLWWQRSGREDTMVGVAVRKQAEMGLWVQRSGREGAVVGFAGQGQTEANLWWQRSGRERTVVGFAERGEGGVREEGKREGRARREGEEGDSHAKQRSGAWIGGFGPLFLSCRMVFPAVWLMCRESAVTYFVSLSIRFLRDASSTISPSTSSPSAMMKAAGMAGMLYIPMYGDAFPRASQTFVHGSS